jgi:XTP/dITP diphosphohydrolase
MNNSDLNLLIASANPHKVDEIKSILAGAVNIKSLADIHFTAELPETSGTIPGNAMQKARTLFGLTGLNCLADDSGLLIEALNGAPGVDSAFYAGLPRNEKANIDKVLTELSGKSSRKAAFITVMALILDGKEYLFEGRVEGHIADSPRGTNGFGYDPVFIPNGHERTFAELSPEDKNKISHRKMATDQVINFLISFKNQ